MDSESDLTRKKRSRESAALEGFGADLEDIEVENSKLAKLSEGDLPKHERVAEISQEENDSTKLNNSKRTATLDDIFATNEEDDYDQSVDRASRLAYLNSIGSKKRGQKGSNDDSDFHGSTGDNSDDIPGYGARISGKGDSIFKSPSKPLTRSKLEQQEFVKDSVQSKIARESTPLLKSASSKSLDFGALMQKIAERQKSIKLPTAEQVGLKSLLGQDADDEANEGEELSLEEGEEDDEISLEIDDDDEQEENGKIAISEKATPKPSSANFKAPALPATAMRSKKTVLDEEDDGSAESTIGNVKTVTAAPRAPSAPKQLLSLDDFTLEDEDEGVTVALTPSLSQTMNILPETVTAPTDESSQSSVTESSLQLEYPATIEPEAVEVTTTPGGLALKSENENKPSLLSSWLSGTSKPNTAKKSSSSVTKAKSEAAISRTKAKKREIVGAPLLDPEILDENAMTGNDDSNGVLATSTSSMGMKLEKSGSSLRRLQKTRQLFDDEAEAGYGSEGDRLDAKERDEAVSADESEGGSSQDAYEDEGVHPADSAKRASALDDIFETDDRSVVRSLQMKQELDRERAEQKAMEDMVWRRERRSRRYELALHAEANALIDDQKMDERLAARRTQKRDSKKDNGKLDSGRVMGDSASLPVEATGGEKEWFMDDSDEEDGDEESREARRESERRRLELLDEQQSRRRLASNSLFLSHDEDSQSILQVIERANTQHSQHSNPASSLDDNNSSSQFASFSVVSESQDSLGGWFDRPGMSSSTFSASNAEHLAKLKSSYKGHATQILSSSMLFQRSQDGFEGSQDGFKDPAPLTRSQSNMNVSSSSKRKK